MPSHANTIVFRRQFERFLAERTFHGAFALSSGRAAQPCGETAQKADVAGGRGDISNRPVTAHGAKASGFETRNSQLARRWISSDSAVLLAQTRTACLRASLALLRRRTARNDAAACQDEPIAAPLLNSQDAPRPRDSISGRYLLRARATVNQRDAVAYILYAIVPEQGPRVVGSGCFIRGGRFRRRHKRRLFRRARRAGIGRTSARDGGSLLQLVEPCRETSNF
jgi:hypothetical protein